MFNAGLVNDKLPLLYKENQNALVAVKVNGVLSQRIPVKNVMQGKKWGTSACTSRLDKLGQKAYKEQKLLYKYKGEVPIPPLEMVDDVLTLAKCQNDATIINSVVNAFMETKKLKLSHKKCNTIHIQKQHNKMKCTNMKVHGEQMKNSKQEKYLGDLI